MIVSAQFKAPAVELGLHAWRQTSFTESSSGYHNARNGKDFSQPEMVLNVVVILVTKIMMYFELVPMPYGHSRIACNSSRTFWKNSRSSRNSFRLVPSS